MFPKVYPLVKCRFYDCRRESWPTSCRMKALQDVAQTRFALPDSTGKWRKGGAQCAASKYPTCRRTCRAALSVRNLGCKSRCRGRIVGGRRGKSQRAVTCGDGWQFCSYLHATKARCINCPEVTFCVSVDGLTRDVYSNLNHVPPSSAGSSAAWQPRHPCGYREFRDILSNL